MSGRQILVVDDEAKMRRVLEIMLQKMGHRVFGAGNGNEALTVFAAHAIDLVIADVRMPEMDGIELLANLRAQQSGCAGDRDHGAWHDRNRSRRDEARRQ